MSKSSDAEELWDYITVNVNYDESLLSAIREFVGLKSRELANIISQKGFMPGELRGQYKIVERLPKKTKTSKNIRFRVQCTKCGELLIRYPNKLSISHIGCTDK